MLSLIHPVERLLFYQNNVRIKTVLMIANWKGCYKNIVLQEVTSQQCTPLIVITYNAISRIILSQSSNPIRRENTFLFIRLAGSIEEESVYNLNHSIIKITLSMAQTVVIISVVYCKYIYEKINCYKFVY